MTKDDLLKDLLHDISELEAPWDLITESVAVQVEAAPQADRAKLIADYTISISTLHALEAIAKGIAVIAQEDF